MDLPDVRGRVGVVSQETVLFNGSIRENIQPGRLDATEEQLQDALRVAHLTDWINTLPDGLDSPVGDRAGFLSGGQKQRIAIARAYLKDAPILVLDEATSALDNESEALVQQALIELVRGRTVIMVAHRLSTIRHADRILVMENGQITETGTHEELLAMDGIYHKLYLLQFRESERHLLEKPKVS
jgi:subfamily B ATP-binding cassette protein MsbA